MFISSCSLIGTGDLGTTASEVEEELERNFALASRWECILLLDEADVFLAQRERKDFVRNGLVAGETNVNSNEIYNRVAKVIQCFSEYSNTILAFYSSLPIELAILTKHLLPVFT